MLGLADVAWAGVRKKTPSRGRWLIPSSRKVRNWRATFQEFVVKIAAGRGLT